MYIYIYVDDDLHTSKRPLFSVPFCQAKFQSKSKPHKCGFEHTGVLPETWIDMNWWDTLQGTKISYLGQKKIIIKSVLGRWYVSSRRVKFVKKSVAFGIPTGISENDTPNSRNRYCRYHFTRKPIGFWYGNSDTKAHVLVYLRSSNAGISAAYHWKWWIIQPSEMTGISFCIFFGCSTPLKKNCPDFPWRKTLGRRFSATNSLLLLPCFLTHLVRETVLIRMNYGLMFKRSLAALYCLHQPCYNRCYRRYEIHEIHEVDTHRIILHTSSRFPQHLKI